jgi:hypothetical protein
LSESRRFGAASNRTIAASERFRQRRVVASGRTAGVRPQPDQPSDAAPQPRPSTTVAERTGRILILNPAGRNLFANQSWPGLSAAELDGASIFDHLDASSGGKLRQRLRSAARDAPEFKIRGAELAGADEGVPPGNYSGTTFWRMYSSIRGGRGPM